MDGISTYGWQLSILRLNFGVYLKDAWLDKYVKALVSSELQSIHAPCLAASTETPSNRGYDNFLHLCPLYSNISSDSDALQNALFRSGCEAVSLRKPVMA